MSRSPRGWLEAYRNAVTLTLKIHLSPSFILWLSSGHCAGVSRWNVGDSARQVLLVSWRVGVEDSCFGFLVVQLSDLIWPATERTDACWGSVTGATQAPGDFGKENLVWRGVIWNFLFGPLLTIPVRLPGGVDMCIGCLMRKCIVVTDGWSPSISRIRCLSFFPCLYCNES